MKVKWEAGAFYEAMAPFPRFGQLCSRDHCLALHIIDSICVSLHYAPFCWIRLTSFFSFSTLVPDAQRVGCTGRYAWILYYSPTQRELFTTSASYVLDLILSAQGVQL